MKKYFIFVLLLLGSIAVLAQGIDSLEIHLVMVDPDIVHGTLSVRPVGDVQEGARVRVAATPDPDYELESITVYNIQEPEQIVDFVEDHFVMPDFDVMVTASFVEVVPAIELTIIGDAMAITMQECEYSVRKENGLTYTWEVSDPLATVQANNNSVKVCWGTAGDQMVTVLAMGPQGGSSSSAEMMVKVQSFVNPSDLNAIVAKKHNGKDYILIYPNPKENYRYQWYKDGQKIAGANGQYYYKEGGLDAGFYKLYLSFNADANGNLFGGAFTDDYMVWGVNKLDICPNPAQEGDDLVVVNETGSELAVTIYSVDGRMVHCQNVSGTQTVIGANLKKGIYLVHFNDGNNDEVQKIVIK